MPIAILAAVSGIYYPKISLLPVLPQLKTTAYLVKVKVSNYHINFNTEFWLLSAFLIRARHAAKVE